MLEAPAQLATVAVVGLLSLRLTNRTGSPARARWTLAGAGACLALAMSTKATFGMVAGAMLVLLLITGWVIERREAVRCSSSARSATSPCPGDGLDVGEPARAGSRPSGTASAGWSGVHQETGFNAPTTKVTLGERIGANLGQYGVTYLLLAVGGAARSGADLAGQAVAADLAHRRGEGPG